MMAEPRAARRQARRDVDVLVVGGGVVGAATAVLAILVPSSVLYCLASRVWDRYRGTAIHSALESGLAPVGTGLMFAGAVALLRAADAGLAGWAVAAAATGVMLWRNLHPLLVIFAAGAVFGALRLA